jgi:hypothetical protein
MMSDDLKYLTDEERAVMIISCHCPACQRTEFIARRLNEARYKLTVSREPLKELLGGAIGGGKTNKSGIYITSLKQPSEEGSIVAIRCEGCHSTEFVFDRWMIKPKDGDFFLISMPCGRHWYRAGMYEAYRHREEEL